ncbi:male-enhanced antigen 1 [Hydra vulgaris]|uniref:Male-enhanced antigen 1 n=1 Tax=Hydra vulgaris TaxID=6087 RepID=A0ABM4CIE2_HYDVU
MSPESNIENNSKKNENISDELNSQVHHSSRFEFTSSEEDDVDTNQSEYAGYQLLSQDLSCNYSSEDERDEISVDNDELYNTENICIDYQNLVCSAIEDGLSSTGLEFPEYDNHAECGTFEKNDFKISETHAELIKKSMSGFSLPTTNIPEWAKDVSDDQLKETLRKAINEKSQGK